MAADKVQTDIEGRVRKIRARQPVLALFEIVANAIEAVGEVKDHAGTISVLVVRAPAQQALLVDELPVSGFVVEDDGIGFTDENHDSFYRADSTYKFSRGGKGIGRFSVLKFFDALKIDSVYGDATALSRRSFTFTLQGIEQANVDTKMDRPRKTTVELRGIKSDYEKKLPNTAAALAEALVEHFITYFATGSCPRVTVRDGAESIVLQDYYREQYAESAVAHEFTIGSHVFKTNSIRIHKGNRVHSILFCANKRVAERVPLNRTEPILTRKLEDKDGEQFAYWVFLEGNYLDSAVTDDRAGFRFPEHDEADGSDIEFDLTRGQLIAAAMPQILQDLEAELKSVRAQNLERAKSYAKDKAPEYRNVIMLRPESVEIITKTIDKEIDLELRKIQFDIEVETVSKAQACLEAASSSGATPEEIRTKTQELMKSVNEAGKSNLARYVSQRRVVLDLLERRMQLNSDGKHDLEAAIHEVIFPMMTTSDDISKEDQNLWVLDERLSFHSFLASDKPLTSTPVPADGSTKEPDIIVFNRPIAFHGADESKGVYSSIEIVEFKRPMLDDYTDDKNPALQVMKYIEIIRDGKVMDSKGRPVKAMDTTHFHCWVACDLTEKLKKILYRLGFLDTPDQQGMFQLARHHNAYIEVISYDKMLRIAKERNRILFKKLQLQ